ncbi:MAG: transporter [Symbiobacteriaceae bacterium]|jgi:hypothetical protein|nr:transporter [Symbiobacteriaceae bacterium]
MEEIQLETRRLRDIETLPAWASDDARNVWELARSGGSPGVDAEAGALAYLDHPEFAVLADHAGALPPRFTVEGVNPRFHVLTHQVVEAQLLNNDPPEARTTLAHLLGLGIDRHAAIHLMMEGLIKDIRTALQHELPSGYVPFLKRMALARVGTGAGAAAAATDAAKVGRNDTCPCGSGKKYKKCCGTDGPVPFIDLRRAGMLLGEPYYAGEDAAKLPPGHPLVTLDNLAAVAHALEAAGALPVAAAAYRRLASCAEAQGEEYLADALEDQMEFALNHAPYAADGITAAHRLLEMSVASSDQETLKLNLAELHEAAGHPGEAEAAYQELLAGIAHSPWVHLSWARWLAKHGRNEAAREAYQTVIDKKGMGEPHALDQARAELGKLI